jgi:hypothetical protein
MTVLMRVKTGLGIAGAALALGAAAPASGATIVGLHDTGVNSDGTVRAPDATTPDLHYSVTAAAFGVNVTDPGLLVVPALATPQDVFVTSGHPSWSPNSAVGSIGSAWITNFINSNATPAPSGSLYPVGGFIGNVYDYTLTFNLVGLSAASAALSGQVQADNFVTVLLNGVEIGGQTPVASPGIGNYFKKFKAFGTEDNFLMGENKLTFRVTDYGVVTGLRVSNLIGTAVPEPATWAMLIVGFGLVASQIRRRRRAAPLAMA